MARNGLRHQHGKHNESLCKKLLKEGVYFDWVVTTAFYSALHFVEDSLFPVELHKGVIANSTGDVKQIWKSHISQHAVRKKLVRMHLKNLEPEYLYLEKGSRKARYIDYQVEVHQAKVAYRKLQTLMAKCEKAA